MSKERILSYQLSQKITDEEINEIAAAGQAVNVTYGGSYSPTTHEFDPKGDI